MADQGTEDRNRGNDEESRRATLREKRRQKLVAVAFFTFFIILWLVIHFTNRVLTGKDSSRFGGPKYKVVEIVPGSHVSEIADRLAEQKIISSKLFFRLAAHGRGSTRKLKAGEYRFDASLSLVQVLRWLEQGHVMLHRVTVLEGSTVKQVARLLANKELADYERFMSLAEDPEFLQALGISGPTLEGYLFPDTYKVAKGLPEEKLIRIMVDRFWEKCSPVIRSKIVSSDMTLHEIVIIASIVEKEALYDDETPLIAGVIYNRLRRNMPLQCDVTIRYPLDNYGVRLTYADLRMDSPYNSYLFRGLPPTPICNPGLAAIEAALNPAETDYLYFVSMNNGRHKFSVSLQEHNDAVYRYQILNERG